MRINWLPKRDCFIEGRCPNGKAWIRLKRDGRPDAYYLILDGVKTKRPAKNTDSVADLKMEADQEYSRFLAALEIISKNSD